MAFETIAVLSPVSPPTLSAWLLASTVDEVVIDNGLVDAPKAALLPAIANPPPLIV